MKDIYRYKKSTAILLSIGMAIVGILMFLAIFYGFYFAISTISGVP